MTDRYQVSAMSVGLARDCEEKDGEGGGLSKDARVRLSYELSCFPLRGVCTLWVCSTARLLCDELKKRDY